MTALFSAALAQTQLPTWWDNPAEPWRSNLGARIRSEENRQSLLRVIRMAGKPVALKEAAEAADLSVASVRNLIQPAIEAGQVRREVIDGIIHLEIV